MGKIRNKFFTAEIVKKSGKAKPVGKAFRFNEGTIYVHLRKKELRSKTVKLTPITGRL